MPNTAPETKLALADSVPTSLPAPEFHSPGPPALTVSMAPDATET